MDDVEIQSLDAAIQDAIVPQGGVLTHYVVVAEYHDGERLFITGATSENLPQWQRLGLLDYGSDGLEWEDGEDA